MASPNNFFNVANNPFLANTTPDHQSQFPAPSTQLTENNFSGPTPMENFLNVHNPFIDNVALDFGSLFPSSTTENPIGPTPMGSTENPSFDYVYQRLLGDTAADYSTQFPFSSPSMTTEISFDVANPFPGNVTPEDYMSVIPSTHWNESNIFVPAHMQPDYMSATMTTEIYSNVANLPSTQWTGNSSFVPPDYMSAPMAKEMSLDIANTAAEARNEYTGLLSDVVNFDSVRRRQLGAAVNISERELTPRLPPHNEAEAEAEIRNGRLNSPEKRGKSNHWSKDEHMLFLHGLETCGPGRWKEISAEMVVTKTPTQVASHAQKHILRRGKSSEHKLKFPSIHDINTVDPDLVARLLADRRQRLPPPPPSTTSEPSNSDGTYIDFTAVSRFDSQLHSS